MARMSGIATLRPILRPMLSGFGSGAVVPTRGEFEVVFGSGIVCAVEVDVVEEIDNVDDIEETPSLNGPRGFPTPIENCRRVLFWQQLTSSDEQQYLL
jgi:hypothetical protein